MEQLNRIEILGSLGSVRIRAVNEKKVANLSVVTNYIYKSMTGEPVIETTWFNVTAWEGKGIIPFEKLEKGSKVRVAGRLRSQRYNDGEGVEHIYYDVLAYQLGIIEGSSPFQDDFVG